jgi:hypothetical protein
MAQLLTTTDNLLFFFAIIEYNNVGFSAFPKTMIFTAIPIVILFSLCYAATRYEDMRSIFRHTVFFGGWLTFAMVLTIAIMELVYWHLH